MEIQIITKLKEFRSDVLICCFIAYVKVTKAGNKKTLSSIFLNIRHHMKIQYRG